MGCKYFAVLDLKQALAFVPRCDLIERIRGLVDADLAEMIEAMLLESLVSTISDTLGVQLGIERSVPEGSPLSASFFNVFIDPIAWEVKKTAAGRWDNPINLFADGIVMLGPNASKMQEILTTCGSWAVEHGLTWGMRGAGSAGSTTCRAIS